MGKREYKARRVCDAVAAGESVLAGCRRARVSRATFYRWAGCMPAVAAMYEEACRARLEVVEVELAGVRGEIEEIKATVPDVRPRGGVPFGAWLRAVVNPFTTLEELRGLQVRMSRREFRNKRQRLRWKLFVPLMRLDALRLERARLLGRLGRFAGKRAGVAC